MRPLLVALLVFAVYAVPVPAAAQAGDAQAGKTLWEGPATWCKNCHGAKGEGGFGPDLAGRHLTVPQFTRALRQPWGVMPAFVESQVSDKEVGDLLAYFNTLPAATQPGPWRTAVPANAPKGQELMIAGQGCGQCHGAALGGPRADMGAVAADFEWFKTLVYDHTANMNAHWSAIDEKPAVRVRMGNFSPSRLPEPVLREIFDWTKDQGYRVKMAADLGRGVPAANGVTYTLGVDNIGIAGKALTAEDMTISLRIPAGTTVVSATGAGYQGVRNDPQLKGDAAVWQVPRIAPKEHQTYTITLSKAATAADNIRGSVRWTRPAIKGGPDQIGIAPPPAAPATN